MKYSYNWLKELANTQKTAEEMAELLTMHSFELEGLEKKEINLTGVVIGKILEIKKHPDADKLQLTKIEIGKKKLEIVCGAPNIKIGDKVPVALVGAQLPNGIKIRETKIRGVKSVGMLCAEDELDLGENHNGIMILDEDAPVGMSIKKYLEIRNDTIFEIKILPDRAHDAMSYVGVAREMAILDNQKFDYDFAGLKLPKKKSRKLKVIIKDKKLCPRYIGAVMEGVIIKESPDWLRARLEASGIRPINNVVDATNYVMLELGQPLHAFDFSQVQEISKNETAKIIIRKAQKNEKIELLDGEVLKLTVDNLVIANNQEPLVLAGVMGGKNSEINNDTKSIILESANFNAISIRTTRIEHKIRTESSDRFEKNIDPNLAEKAIRRVIEILEHTAEAKLEGVVDIYPQKNKPQKIEINLDYINSLLGEEIKKVEVLKILKSLQFKIIGKEEEKTILVEAPTYRVDLKTPEDVIEDIGRIWGYEKIKPQPLVEPIIPAKINQQLFLERKIRQNIIGLGFDEIYNYSFYGEEDVVNCKLNQKQHLRLENPMNPSQHLVRANLVPNILKNIFINLKHFDSFKIFKIGRNYWLEKGTVKEERKLVMANILKKDQDGETFYEMKGAVEDLLEIIGIDKKALVISKIKELNKYYIHPTRSAEIKINEKLIGYVGEINPLVLLKYKIEKRVALAEIDLRKLLAITQTEKKYQSLKKFPSVTRDISMLVNHDVQVLDIVNLIKRAGKVILKVSLFDVFKKDKKTSLAFHLEFGVDDRTLKNKEIDKEIGKIVTELETKLKVEVRQ